MAYTTKRPTGLSIKRSGANFVCTWKIGDENYSQGQTFQWRIPGSKWRNVVIGNQTTQKTIVIDTSKWYPYRKPRIPSIIVRIRGRRGRFDGKDPAVSAWTQKEYDVQLPPRPTLTATLHSTENNKTTFAWDTTTSNDSYKWCSRCQYQTALVARGTVSGEEVPHSAWSAPVGVATSDSVAITEDSSVINRGTAYIRWFRVRSQGPQGFSEWVYAKHIYAVPYQSKNVKASARMTEAGGYLCTSTWKTSKDALHPVDAINVQYLITIPAEGMTCPDGVSWTDAMTLAYKDGSDAAAFSVDNVVGTDQCLFVRINTVHDRNTTYGNATLVASGSLATPTNLSVTADDSTHMATVTATNASQVADSYMAILYRDTDNPNGFVVGIIEHGATQAIVQCPAWANQTDIQFGVYAVVGDYTLTTRADGVGSYAIDELARSAVQTYGGTVPAAPANVTLEQTTTPGTVRVTFRWSWAAATMAELSWADHEDAWESTDEPDTYIISRMHASAWNISGLETGKTWYIRVRLASGAGNDVTYGAYSDIASIDLSSAPSVPILSVSSGVITEDGTVTASWAYTSTDGTGQESADIAEVVNGAYSVLAEVGGEQNITFSELGWSSGETHLLAVRVTSESGKQSAWSDPVSVTVAEPLTATITQTSLEEQTLTVDSISRTVQVLTEMPLTVTVTGAGTGGTTSVIIERAETYHVSRPDETEFNGFEGETIAIFTQTGEDQISFGLEDLIGNLDDEASYRLIATVQDGLGQSAEAEIPFEVHWEHQATMPTATVSILTDDMVAVITPSATNPAEGDVCDIYRLSVDKPELIYPDAEFGTAYVDPYPAIGEFGGHRVVYKTANGDYITSANKLAWADYSDNFSHDSNIIDFDEGQVLVEFNTDLSHTWAKDFKETKYLGGSVKGDWNPAVSRTGSFSGVCTTSDPDTIEMMRRLAVHTGICHVRTKDGSSYAADVQVSESYAQDTAHKIITFNLSITRVDSEGYDGMTLAEWRQTHAVE